MLAAMDLLPAYHATRLEPLAARARVWRHVAAHLASRWPELRGRVVDLGAGTCDFINQLPAAERFAIDRWTGLPAHAAAGVTPLVQDATASLPTGLDAVFASNLLEHLSIEEAVACLASVRRGLRPGGILACVQPNFRLAWRRYFDDFTHRTVFTDVSLSDLGRSCGLEPCHVAPRFMPLTMKSAGARLSCLVPLYLWSPVKPLAGQMLVVFRKPAA